MPKTVAALYDSRAEAELAGVRLVTQLKAKPPRIIGKDTVAAVDSLKISKEDADTYREELRRGAHLLVSEVPSGANAERVIELLEKAADGRSEERADRQWGDGRQGVHVDVRDDTPPPTPRESVLGAQTHIQGKEEQESPRDAELEDRPGTASEAPLDAGVEEQTEVARNAPPQTESPEESRAPVAEGELRIGRRQVAGATARVRSFTYEAPAEEQVSMRDEVIEVESRPCERRLTDSEVEAGGLFKERVFEATEMREEPVVTKVAVVREEVIVRKAVKERNETIRDTVRLTEVEVEDLPASEAAALFGQTHQPASKAADQRSTNVDEVRGTSADLDEAQPGEGERGTRSSGWF